MAAAGSAAPAALSLSDAGGDEEGDEDDVMPIDDVLRAALSKAGLVRAGWVAAALESQEDRDTFLESELGFPSEVVREIARARLSLMVLGAAEVARRRRRKATAAAPNSS